jgi:hypothetical protein
MNITKIKRNKNNILILIILLSWAHQWLSIGSFINASYEYFSINSILTYRNQSLFIFAMNLIIFFFNKEKNIKKNIFFYFFLIPAAYLLGLINLLIDTPSEKDVSFFWHFTFILQMINALLIINNFYKIDGADDAILLKINLIILLIYTVIIYTAQDFYLRVEYHINFWNFKISTNSNGISRILSMINIFLTCNYFIKKRNMIILFLIFFINFMIISMESRQGVILILVQLLLVIFYCYKKNELIKKILKYLLVLIIIPVCLSFIYKNSPKNSRLYLFQGELKNFTKDKGFENNINEITTGRLNKWKISSNHIINSETKNLLFGNGPEFDRKILQAKGNDVANGMIYIILCGGIFGLFSFFITIKKSSNIIFSAFNNKKKFNKDVYFCFSIACIISLTLRTLVENGFLVYGVDFLLAISSFFYTAKKLKLI